MAAETSRSGYSVDSYIGYLISLTSNCEIRYEGIIDYINLEECSICLRNVRCFGTEGRQKAGLKIPPSEKVYEYIIFRATDVKDLLLISPPPVQTVPIHNDSAILQSRYSPMGPASTPGSGSISDQRSQAIQLGSARSTLQGGLPLYQATKNIESLGSIPVCSGFGIPMYWQGFTPTSGNSHLPQAPLLSAPPGFSIPHSLQQHAQFSTVNPLFSSGTLGFHEATTSPPPIVSCASTLMSTSVQHPNVNSSTSVQHPNVNSFFATTPNLSQYFSSLAPPASCTPSLNSISLPATVAHTHASLLAAEPSLNLLPNRSLLNSNLASVFGLNIPSVLPLGYINTPGTSLHENIASIRSSPSLPSLPFQTFSQSMPSSISSFSSIQGDTTLPLVTLGQLQHPSYSMLPSPLPLLTIHEDAKFKAPEIKIKSESEPLTDELPPLATSTKEPLMPLPRHRSYSRLPSSLPVQTIHEDEKFTAQEPKIKSESEPLTYELTSPATSMIEPLLPKHPSYSPVSSSLPVQTIHKDAKFKAQEPKMKSESEPFKYEVPPSAGPMKEPLLPLPIHPCYSSLSSLLPVQTIHEDAELKAQGLKIKSGSGPLKYEMPPSARSMKEPLLPLPELTHRRYSRPVIRYSEDFDFIAMNEKFNKAEVWGQLGKGKGLVQYDERGQSSNENAVQEEDEESPNLVTQPAYSKDDFFDKISYRTSDPGTHSGSARVLEQLKVDMDTSGDFPRRRSNRGGGRGFRDRNDGR